MRFFSMPACTSRAATKLINAVVLLAYLSAKTSAPISRASPSTTSIAIFSFILTPFCEPTGLIKRQSAFQTTITQLLVPHSPAGRRSRSADCSTTVPGLATSSVACQPHRALANNSAPLAAVYSETRRGVPGPAILPPELPGGTRQRTSCRVMKLPGVRPAPRSSVPPTSSATHRRTAERVARGMCPRCGERPPAPERSQCEPCLEKDAAAGRARGRQAPGSRPAAPRPRQGARVPPRTHPPPGRGAQSRGPVHGDAARPRRRPAAWLLMSAVGFPCRGRGHRCPLLPRREDLPPIGGTKHQSGSSRIPTISMICGPEHRSVPPRIAAASMVFPARHRSVARTGPPYDGNPWRRPPHSPSGPLALCRPGGPSGVGIRGKLDPDRPFS